MGKTKALRVFLAPEKSQPEYTLKNKAHYKKDHGSRCTASEICSYRRNQSRKCNDMLHFKMPIFTPPTPNTAGTHSDASFFFRSPSLYSSSSIRMTRCIAGTVVSLSQFWLRSMPRRNPSKSVPITVSLYRFSILGTYSAPVPSTVHAYIL